MKKKMFVLLSIVVIFMSCSSEKEAMEKLITENEFSFWLVNQNGTYGGAVQNDHDVWNCNFGTDFFYFGFDSREIFEDKVTVYFLTCNFIVCGEPSYREYGYPERGSFSITKKQIQKRIDNIKNGNNKENNEIIKDSIYEIPEQCKGLVIADNVRIRQSPSSNSSVNIIGKLNKFQKVTLLGYSDSEKIDGMESPWYKIRLEDGTEGWIFGGFAKIYFSDEDLQLLYKAFEEEGSEYTNQFITPDNS